MNDPIAPVSDADDTATALAGMPAMRRAVLMDVFATMDAGDLDGMVKHMTDDVITQFGNQAEICGKAAFRTLFNQVGQAISGLRHDILDLWHAVEDFDVWLHPGQVATVCQAINGHRAEYIAVINDSTGEQFYNERALWRIASPGFDRLLLGLFAGLFFWLLLVAVIAWALVVRSQVRRFQYIGVGPILSRANAEARALSKPWAA